MRNAHKSLIALTIAAAVLGGCKKDPDVDPNVVAADNAQTDANAVADNSFDTLPADESSTTPSNQLVNGLDNPDVNETSDTNSD
jgi:PBP1b-binding outer membrane lipoprotein LpoB